MDTNPFANNNQQQQQQVPSYLQQTNNPTMPGAISNMIKAIMQGNNEYKQRQAQMGGAQQLGSLPAGSSVPGTQGPTSVGGASGPMPLNADASSVAPSPVPASSAGGGVSPMGGFMDQHGGLLSMLPSSPVSQDPVSQALMSPIPGMDSGAGFAMPNPLSIGGAWG